MKVRTQLLLAFLLLAVVPLAGIVLYSYVTSYRAFRNAVGAETRLLAGEMRQRMEAVRSDLARRVERLGRLRLGLLGRPEESSLEAGRVYADLMTLLGERWTLVEAFEIRPVPESGAEIFYLHPSETLADAIVRLEARRGVDPAGAGISEEYLAATIGQAVRGRELLTAGEIEALEATAEETRLLLGREFGARFPGDGRAGGFLRALIPATSVLRQVISGTRRAEGEVPYARDSAGSLWVADPSDRDLITSLSLPPAGGAGAAIGGTGRDEWIIAETSDPESGLVFGIARPTGESLRQFRSTAVRNFAYGLGIVALALVGILWLSARMTRDLSLLTAGAEQLAQGDLGARVPVRSNDEFGRLARTFNRMARELKEKQRRLVEEERRRRDQEVQRRLLEAENERKSRELEEARQLQLSLLPKSLPEHPEIEVAVYMKTATEVGGDYYDFFPAAGALTTAIGDAAGHGAKAGTMVTVIKGLFSVGAAHAALPEVLQEAARAIKRMNLGRMNMAASLVRIEDRRLTVSAAGMPPALLYRRQAAAVIEVALAGMPLGSLADVSYEQWESELEPGDTVLLMSDGFPELLNERQEPMGYRRVRQLFEGIASLSGDEIISSLAGEAEKWSGARPLEDDITFVVLKMRRQA